MQETQETQVQFLGREDHFEEGMATHSSILAQRNPMDGEAWQATIHRVVEELDSTELTEHSCACYTLSLGSLFLSCLYNIHINNSFW